MVVPRAPMRRGLAESATSAPRSAATGSSTKVKANPLRRVRLHFSQELKSSAGSAENRAGMSGVAAIEVVREQSGRFLGYRGALLALPFGWEAWNAYRSRALVGSLAVSAGSAGSFDWAEADYEGPFFAPGSSPSLLDPAAPVARMECVYIAPGLRGGELWSRYAAILAGLGLPVYAAFANPRLGERFRAAHSPAGCTTSAR